MTELQVLDVIHKQRHNRWPVSYALHGRKATLLVAAMASLSGTLPTCKTLLDVHLAVASSLARMNDGRITGEQLGLEARRIRDLQDEHRSKIATTN